MSKSMLKRLRDIRYIYALPGMVYLMGFLFSAFIFIVVLSLFDVEFPFILKGLTNNYVKLLTDDRFWNSLMVSYKLAAVTVPIEVLLGLVLALIVSQRLPGMSLFMILILAPMLTIPIAWANIWRLLLIEYGPVNELLTGWGIIPKAIGFFGDINLSFWAIALCDIIEWTPFCALIIIAGVQAIPPQVIEASRVDGAGSLIRFRRIILPIIIPSILTALLLRLMDSFKTFDIIYMCTMGGPGIVTEVSSLYIYKMAFVHMDVGYASAATVILFLLVVFTCLLVYRVSLRIVRKLGVVVG